MSIKMSPSLQSIIPAQGAKKKIPSMSRFDDLRLTYLQQFKRYLLPLVPLPQKTASQLCQLQQPLLPRYNPVPLLEAQVHQEGEVLQEEEEEVHQEEEEEVHQEEEGVRPAEEWEETPHKLLLATKSPWACYPPYLKEITQKLRAFSENSPPTSSLTMMSQPLPLSSKESLLPSLASKDPKSIDGPNNNSNG